MGFGMMPEKRDTEGGEAAEEGVASRPPDSKHQRHQLVYRLERIEPFEEKEVPGHEFHYCDGPSGLAKFQAGGRRVLGAVGFAKALAKLSTPRRELYLFLSGDRVTHYGWVNIGFCKHYRVEPRDVTIGPIWSDESFRGNGLATEGLRRAISVMARRGFSVFYIDTSDDNIPCQKAITKASFPPPVATYPRDR